MSRRVVIPTRMPGDWFRRTTWSLADREDFFARLGRAHKTGRAQYLRIQAVHLEEAGLPAPALELLEILLKDYPSSFEEASALLQRARCLAGLGRRDKAVESFRSALEAERNYPNRQTEAWLDFGWFVISLDRRDLFSEVTAVLDEFEPDRSLLFPIQRYRFNVIRAIIADALDDRPAARRHAEAAVAAAAEDRSGLRYHPTLGLVGEQRTDLHRRVKELAG